MPVDIRNRTAAPARGAPSTIDTLFIPASIPGGTVPVGEVLTLRSITDYEIAGGARDDAPVIYDGLDTFFREGGRQAYLVRFDADAGAGVDTLAEALPLFGKNLGGGHVVGWGLVPDAATYGALVNWAADNKRYALLDVAVEDDTLAELVAKGAVFAGLDANVDYGALFGPWVEIPGQSGVIGSEPRQAPASAAIAALCSRADALGNPNRAPAGRDFPFQYVTGFVGAIDDVGAVAMRSAGINPLREVFGLLVLDGFQTGIPQSPDTPFWQANPGRARMWLQWRALIAGLNYEYKNLDGRGRLTGKLKTDLEAIAYELWQVDGLFGETAQDAFSVNVGASVNTEGDAALGELHGAMEARFSEHARDVIIDLVSVPVTGRVSSAA